MKAPRNTVCAEPMAHPCGMTAALVIMLAIPVDQSVHGALFECQDPAGVLVITDSPSQLILCRPLGEQAPDASRLSPAPPNSAPVPPAPREAPPERQPPDQSPGSMITVPLQRIGSLLVVTLTINRTREARLIVDTGASHTILSHRIAQDLDLYADASTTPVTMHTVGGSVRGDVVRVDSIRVAHAEVRGTTAAIYDLPDAPAGVDGLLGLSFLRQFRVTVDTAYDQLVLTRAAP